MKNKDFVFSLSKENLTELSAKPFEVKIRGKIFKGFVIRRGKDYFAYENICQHLPVTLDLRDGMFFNHDKTALQCHMHGALYEIDTGKCFGGPCIGANLKGLKLIEERNRLLISIPID